MHKVYSVVYQIGKVLSIISAAIIIAMMLLIVANISFRLFGEVVQGTYEIVKLLIVIAAALAVGYTAITKGHVEIMVLITRFSQRVQTIFKAITLFISIAFLVVLMWGNVWTISQKMQINEVSDVLKIPFLPFRIIMVFGLMFFCLVLIMDLCKIIRKEPPD